MISGGWVLLGGGVGGFRLKEVLTLVRRGGWRARRRCKMVARGGMSSPQRRRISPEEGEEGFLYGQIQIY